MKKLISFISATAIAAMLAVPASAALTYAPDSDGWYVIETAPTDAEVAAYEPTLTTTVVKAASTDDLKAWGTAINKKYGSKFTAGSIDVYKVTYDMANIGTFVNGYDSNYNSAFFGLYDITIGYDSKVLPEGFEVTALNYTLPDGSTGTVKAGVDAATKVLNVAYTSAGVTSDTIFPARTTDEGLAVTAGTYKAEYVLSVAKDTKVTIPYVQTKIVYKTTVGSYNTTPATTKVAGQDIVLGDSEPKLADFTALNVAIAAYEAKTEADYTAESWATAKAAYDTAKAIDQTTVTDQTVVDAATNALNNAVAALVLKPVVVDKLEVKPDAIQSKVMPNGQLTFGVGGTVEITGTKSFTKLVFALEDTVNSKSAPYTWDFGTAINASVSYGLNITGCPAGSNITATVTAE